MQRCLKKKGSLHGPGIGNYKSYGKFYYQEFVYLGKQFLGICVSLISTAHQRSRKHIQIPLMTYGGWTSYNLMKNSATFHLFSQIYLSTTFSHSVFQINHGPRRLLFFLHRFPNDQNTNVQHHIREMLGGKKDSTCIFYRKKLEVQKFFVGKYYFSRDCWSDLHFHRCFVLPPCLWFWFSLIWL